jgi:hypothetical protein
LDCRAESDDGRNAQRTGKYGNVTCAATAGQNECRHIASSEHGCIRWGQIESTDDTKTVGGLEIIITPASQAAQQAIFDITQVEDPFPDILVFQVGKLAGDFTAGLVNGRAGVNQTLSYDTLGTINQEFVFEDQELAFQDGDVAAIEIPTESFDQGRDLTSSLVQNGTETLNFFRNRLCG